MAEKKKPTPQIYEGLQEDIGVKTHHANRNCKICNKHPDLVPVIDTMMAAQIPYRQISKMIAEEHGVKITIYDLSVHKRHQLEEGFEINIEAIDEDFIKKLKRADAIQHERVKNQIMAEKVRAVIKALIDNGMWKNVRPDMMRALADLYKTVTSEVRLAAAEEYRQIEHEETDLIEGLMKAIGQLEGKDADKKVSDAKETGGSSEG
jgi:hypothetical protein